VELEASLVQLGIRTIVSAIAVQRLAECRGFLNMNNLNSGIWLSVGFVLSLAGCASISVQPGTAVATKGLPEKVYVEPFATAGGDINVDREGAELAQFKSDLQVMMTTAITVDLSSRLIPAVAAGKIDFSRRQNAWLLRGEFVRVNQGSRLLRGAIGFGAGATKLETRVQVIDLSTGDGKPFLTFSTTGGSNAEPGAITSITTDPLTLAIEAAAGGAGNVAHGVTEDTKRTAREITAELSDYMYRSGWIPEGKWVPPKQYSN